MNTTYKLNIVDAIMEMGGQINPLTVTVSLFDRGIISHMYGLTLLLPTIADINLGLIYSGNMYRSSIYYVPNILSLDNHYGQGYSMISELWLNFGLIGVMIICFSIGYVCSSYEQSHMNSNQMIKYGGFSLMLFYWVRNSLQMNIEIVILTFIMIFICEKITIGRGN